MALHPYISLCSGIGGLDLAVRDALPGARCVLYVERDLTAAAVLAARMEDETLDAAPIWSDLCTLDTGRWRGRVAGVIGGIPCQPWSTAGKRAGRDDERHLWPDALRIIRDVQPAWVFIENVGGAVRELGEGIVRPDLEGIGYRTTAGIFTAQEVGAPHRRERLFILAVANSTGARRDGSAGTGVNGAWRASRGLATNSGELADPGHGTGSPERQFAQVGEQERTRLLPSGVGERGEGVGDAADIRRSTTNVQHGTQGATPGTGYPLEWPPGPADTDAWARVLAVRPDLAPATPQPEVRPLADGASRNAPRHVEADPASWLRRADKLRLLGNAVVPAQAALAFRTLSAHLGAVKGEQT